MDIMVCHYSWANYLQKTNLFGKLSSLSCLRMINQQSAIYNNVFIIQSNWTNTLYKQIAYGLLTNCSRYSIVSIQYFSCVIGHQSHMVLFLFRTWVDGLAFIKHLSFCSKYICFYYKANFVQSQNTSLVHGLKFAFHKQNFCKKMSKIGWEHGTPSSWEPEGLQKWRWGGSNQNEPNLGGIMTPCVRLQQHSRKFGPATLP